MHVAILGAYGSAGVAAADRIVEALDGPVDEVSLVDPGPAGGLCILRGCMPSKGVLHPAATAHDARSDPRVTGEATQDPERVVSMKNRYINSFADHREAQVQSLAENDGVTLYEREAAFVDTSTIAVGDATINPDYTVIATGSTPSAPPIDGLDAVEYLTSADILDMTSFPESALVIGFGAVGTELAPYLQANGTDVTVLDRGKRPLRRASNNVSDALQTVYTDTFDVDIITETAVESIEDTADGIRAHTDTDDTYEAETVCLFTGRQPATDRLELANAGITVDEDWTNDTLRLRDANNVFAAGDVTGTNQVLHMAKEEGLLAASNILDAERGDNLEAYDPTPHQVLFTGLGKYPYAAVGISPQRAQSDDFTVVTRKASDDGIFGLKHADDGVASLVVNDEGTVVGYEGFHYHADVMAKTAQVIIENELHVSDIPARSYHPTTPEILDGLLREARSKHN